MSLSEQAAATVLESFKDATPDKAEKPVSKRAFVFRALPRIEELLEQNYSLAEIAAAISECGLQISLATLSTYLRDARVAMGVGSRRRRARSKKPGSLSRASGAEGKRSPKTRPPSSETKSGTERLSSRIARPVESPSPPSQARGSFEIPPPRPLSEL